MATRTTTKKRTASSKKRKSTRSRKPASKATGKRTKQPKKATPVSRSGLLDGLGLVGMKSIEPVILAAVISGDPLLLIGRHGTAKSYLLSRICLALGLDWRHYNASLLNYDDLVGYPLPDDDGKLKFVETPASIWGAQAVFLDEISRCRIDLQNKLFPIIHERRVQGIELTDLVYRWAAMNPPTDPDSDDPVSTLDYRGSEPLDPALADRFAFIVNVPDWTDFTENQRRRLVLESEGPLSEEVSAWLHALVEAGRSLLPGIQQECNKVLAAYVHSVCELLQKADTAGLDLSARRGAMLLRNIAAVHAAHLVLGNDVDLETSAGLALAHSLPGRAQGVKIPRVKLLAAHREAWAIAPLSKTDPRRFLLLERNPVRKLRAAAELPCLSRTAFSTIVADSLASLDEGTSHAVAAWLFESGQAGRLVAAVGEQCGALFAEVSTPMEIHVKVPVRSHRHSTWLEIQQVLSKRTGNRRHEAYLRNLLLSLFEQNGFQPPVTPRSIVKKWNATWNALSGGTR